MKKKATWNELCNSAIVIEQVELRTRPSQTRTTNMPGNYKNTRQSTTKLTSGCGFCRNLGKPESECRSHTVKDCPVLAKTECRYCHQLGHTVKQCPMLKAKNNTSQPKQQAQQHKQQAQEPKPKPVVKPVKHKTSNAFAQMVDECEMPGDKTKREDAVQPKKQAPKPLTGAWSKKTGTELLRTTKVIEPVKAQPHFKREDDYDVKPVPFSPEDTMPQDDFWGYAGPKVNCWADDE